MIERRNHLISLLDLLARWPVVGLTGPRGIGKTELARALAHEIQAQTAWYDLDDPADQARLAEPGLALRDARGLVVIDGFQQHPDLLEALRVLLDRPGPGPRFLLVGSAPPELVARAAEILAGRFASHALDGLRVDEVGAGERDRLWLRGGYPGAFLAEDDRAAAAWCQEQIRAAVERDLPRLGARLPPPSLRRLWAMIAQLHGRPLHVAEIGRSLGLGDAQVRRHLDALARAGLVRLLPPFRAELKKRQVLAPRVQVSDTGLLHALLGIADLHALLGHPKAGASWTGFALAQATARLRARPEQCFGWATHAGAALDLLVIRGSFRLGFVVQRTDAPRTARAMHLALADLGLTRLEVLHAGERTFPLAERIRALALSRLSEDLEPF